MSGKVTIGLQHRSDQGFDPIYSGMAAERTLL
jgi:hypothetical protein